MSPTTSFFKISCLPCLPLFLKHLHCTHKQHAGCCQGGGGGPPWWHMTWALRSFIFNHQLFPSPTVLARNVVRQQGRGNGGGPSVLSTPHFLKKLRDRLFPALPSTPCCDGDSCLFQQVSGEACDANAVSRKDKMAPSITLCLLTCNSLTHRRLGVSSNNERWPTCGSAP